MPNTYFQFKQFRIDQGSSGMKVTTDGCLFGAWVASHIATLEKSPARILDIGAGTGLLSLMVAQVALRSKIDAIEIDDSAFAEATKNFTTSKWSDRLTCKRVSLQNFHFTDSYDLIVSNPPFFKKNMKGKEATKNRAIHNDQLPMEDLSEGIAQLLSKNGTAYVIYPEWEMGVFEKWMKKQGLLKQAEVVVRNKPEGPVFRVMASFGFREVPVESTEVAIKSERGDYTPSFEKLLREYYL